MSSLPRSFRRSTATIMAEVDHRFMWVYATQTVYPDEHRWSVTGGSHWPHKLEGVEVAVTQLRSGALEIKGLMEVEGLLFERREQIARYDYGRRDFTSVACEKDALEQVYRVLLTAKKAVEA